MKDKEITEQIIGCAFKIHRALGAGFLEKIYENALVIELCKMGLHAERQKPINFGNSVIVRRKFREHKESINPVHPEESC